MSAVVETITPFTEQDCLLEALEELNMGYKILGEHQIQIDRKDFRGHQVFERKQGRFVLRHDSDEFLRYGSYQKRDNRWRTNKEFLTTLEKTYRQVYKEKLERLAQEERERMEQARKAYVQKQKEAIVERAKKKGYKVKEKKVGEQIKLVLVRRRY